MLYENMINIVNQVIQQKVFITLLMILPGLVFVVIMFVWINLAMNQKCPPIDIVNPNPTHAPDMTWIQTTYSATTSIYIEFDREIWQVSTIFNTASLVILGWVVTSLDKLKLPMIILVGCASILLVTVATVFKHRLRNFNLVHIGYLCSLESTGASPYKAEYWGVHHRRKDLEVKEKFSKPWFTTIHGAMDLYAFVFAGLWIVLWFYNAYEVIGSELNESSLFFQLIYRSNITL